MPSLGHSLAVSLAQSLAQSIGGTWNFTDYLAFTNASPRYLINPVTGVVSSFGAGVPAIVTINGKRYLQDEASRTCLPTYNNQLTHANWSKFAAGDTLGTTADPVGGSTAYTYIPSTANNIHGIYQAKVCRTQALCAKANGYNYAWIRYAVSGVVTASVICNLTTGALVEVIEAGGPTQLLFSRSQALAWGGYYFEVTIAADSLYCEYGVSNTASSTTFAGNGTDGAILWLPQASTNTKYEGSLIVTGAAAVTRAKDQAYIPAVSVPVSLKDRCKITVYPAWSSAQVTTGDERELVEFEDNTQNIRCYYDGSDKKVKVEGREKTKLSGINVYSNVANDTTLFISSNSTKKIYSAPLSTGVATELLTLPTDGDMRGICIDSSYIYYLNSGGADIGLWRCTLAGTGSSKLTTIAYAEYVCKNDTHVIWSERFSGKIRSYKLSDGTVADLVTGLNTPCGVWADNTYIFWVTSATPYGVYRRLISGGLPDTIVSSANQVTGLCVLQNSVIYSEYPSSNLYVAPIVTGVGVLLATTVDSAVSSIKSAALYGNTNGVRSKYAFPFSSAATTHSANQALEIELNRANGTMKLSGFTTGNGTTTGTSWSRTDGILRVGMDTNEANQIDGDIRLETF